MKHGLNQEMIRKCTEFELGSTKGPPIAIFPNKTNTHRIRIFVFVAGLKIGKKKMNDLTRDLLMGGSLGAVAKTTMAPIERV
ncbi:MAG: hypothetical protein Q8P67_16545, partial [archaeon]|nr:hypothetical protein [archaeon]